MANLKLRISEVAKEHGMSIAQLADAIGVKPQSLSQYIYQGSFSIERLGDIADALGVEVIELFEVYGNVSSSGSTLEGRCPHCGEPIRVKIF